MRQRSPVALLLVLMSLFSAGCAPAPDKRAAPLAEGIVAKLRADPAVASASYKYYSPNTIDDPGPHLSVYVQVSSSQASVDVLKAQARHVAEEVWRTPVYLDKVQVYVSRPAGGLSGSAVPPTPGIKASDLLEVQVGLNYTPARETLPSAEPRFSGEPESAQWDLIQLRFGEELQRDCYAKYGPHKA